jgi:hypothetical protein
MLQVSLVFSDANAHDFRSFRFITKENLIICFPAIDRELLWKGPTGIFKAWIAHRRRSRITLEPAQRFFRNNNWVNFLMIFSICAITGINFGVES